MLNIFWDTNAKKDLCVVARLVRRSFVFIAFLVLLVFSTPRQNSDTKNSNKYIFHFDGLL